MLYSILGTAVWRLIRVFVSGKPYEYLFQNIDTAVASAVGVGMAGYFVAKWEWLDNEDEYEDGPKAARTSPDSLSER